MISSLAAKPRAFSISVLLVLVLAPLVVQSASVAYADSAVSPAVSSCASAVQQTYDAMNQSDAITNALHSPSYASGTSSYFTPAFSSIFQIDKDISPYPTCSEQVLSYNVVFTLYNSTGGWAGYLVITESQNLVVIGSSYQLQRVVSTNIDPAWAGYEFQGNSGATQAVYESESDFTQPTISYPSYGCATSTGTCNISTWVGLEDAHSASDGELAQAGTIVYCTVSGGSCSTTLYYGFYQTGAFASTTLCSASTGGSMTISGGNSMYAYAQNQASYGYGNQYYNYYIDDSTTGTSCWAGNISYSSMTKPLFGAFIVEDAQVCYSYCEPLGGFGTAPFTSAEIYTGGSTNYVNSYSYASIDMENKAGTNPPGCTGSYVLNVDYGTLNSGGDFTMNYHSNQYTPPYTTDC
jgi:hypothetical protein